MPIHEQKKPKIHKKILIRHLKFELTFIKWVVPIVLFLLIAPFTPLLDLEISRYFYSPSTSIEKGHFVQTPFLQLLFTYGTWFAWIVLGASILMLLTRWEKPALVFIITLALGAGLISHLILKYLWLRPRPKQTIEFGGFAPFHPFWIPLTEVTPEPGRSFPCGHCTMGFVFFAFCLIGFRLKNRWLLGSGILLVLFLGVGMSLMRIMQGGHYFSDTLAAALIMWLSALTADAYVYRKKS